MKLFERFSLMMRTSITTLREKVEDPRRMIHQLIVDMEEELVCVRRNVADTIADEILLRKKAEAARAEADQWTERAAAVLRKGDETKARACLEQKVRAAQRADALEDEHRNQREQTQRLQQAVQDIEDRIRQAKQKQTLLLARLVRANSQENINRALDRACEGSAFRHFERFEERVERAEALGEAYDRLDGKEPDATELEAQLRAAERAEELESELSELKRRVGAE